MYSIDCELRIYHPTFDSFSHSIFTIAVAQLPPPITAIFEFDSKVKLFCPKVIKVVTFYNRFVELLYLFGYFISTMKQSIAAFTFIFFLIVSCGKSDLKKKSNPPSERVSTKSENVSILDKQFSVINKTGDSIFRSIWLYLPPDYHTSEKHYPVIYMHDGQNVFDAKTSYAGEWKVDELLNGEFEKNGKGFIVVAIDNNGQERLNEYSPWTHEKYGGGSGDRYIQMIIKNLKPFIDSNYRTLTGPESTAIIGSSMGGLISFYAGLQYPDVFGKIGAISPSFWFSEDVLTFTKEKITPASKSKLYLLLGSEEGMTKEFNAVVDLIGSSDFPDLNIKEKIVQGGKHNEAFWSSEFIETIRFLYDD